MICNHGGLEDLEKILSKEDWRTDLNVIEFIKKKVQLYNSKVIQKQRGKS